MASSFVSASIQAFRANRELAQRAIDQVSDEKLHLAIDENTNSIVVIMKHVSGNLRSRWTDFLSSDGEKDWRNRDSEFVDDFQSRAQLMEVWNRGWDCLFDSMEQLDDVDLDREVTIRGIPHTVPDAIARSLGHTCYHVGQIVLLARHHAGDQWETLTIPKGESEQFNRENWGPR